MKAIAQRVLEKISNQVEMIGNMDDINYFSITRRHYFCERQKKTLTSLDSYSFSLKLLQTLEYTQEEFVLAIKKHGLVE